MLSGNRRWILAGAALAVAATTLTWVLLTSNKPHPTATPPAGQTDIFEVCVFTDAQGVEGDKAAPVWAGVQDAAMVSRIDTSYQKVPGPATVDNARPYLEELLRRHCSLAIAVGPAQVAAVTTDAAKFPHVRFVTVGAETSGGGNGSSPSSNVPNINWSSANDVRLAVRAAVVAAAPPAPTHR